MYLEINFLSQKLMKQTSVNVIIPSYSFDDQMNGIENFHKKGVKFQVLYLLHGAFGDHQDYVKFTNIVRYAEENKIAVIMPSAYNSFYQNTNDGIVASQYWDYIYEELPEIIEAYFPISDKREDKFVAGLSMGGHGSMKMLINGADKFNAGLIMSGVGMEMTQDIFMDIATINSKSDQLVNENNELYQLAKEKADSKQAMPKFYITCGDEDFLLNAVRKSKDLLVANGYDVFYEEVKGYGHEWDFWDVSLKKALYDWLPLKRKVLGTDS